MTRRTRSTLRSFMVSSEDVPILACGVIYASRHLSIRGTPLIDSADGMKNSGRWKLSKVTDGGYSLSRVV
jgi:hypothetical protein